MLNSFLSLVIQNNSKQIKDFGINYKTTEEKRLGNDFLDITLKAKLGKSRSRTSAQEEICTIKRTF